MSTFKIIHNLDQLTEAQRQQYLRDASVYIGLDPDLNGLDLIWLNTDEGLRRLTAYARRGTTDILREIHGITVSSLDQHDGPGYVSFKATGQNKAGRQEIAIGAAVLEGLKGDRIAAAVATAQTRALRRLTLQFVGLAVLDESEVNAFPSPAPQSSPLSQLTLAPPQPTVQPSNDPGKDITSQTVPVKNFFDPKTEITTELVSQQKLKQDDINAKLDAKTQEQFEAYQAKLRADAIAQLNKEAGVEPTHNAPAVDIPQPKKTRKPRGPNKPKVDLGPSAPVPAASTAVKPEAIPAEQATAVATPPPVVTLAAPPPAPTTPSKPRLTPDQVKPFRQRLFRIVNDHLEPNGFTPKEGMGNADKMRALAQVMFSDVTNMNELSVEQWEKYLMNLEYNIATNGPAATVKYIEDTIGI
jgi:hypothetical protein